ncbi:hypothetical protein [Yoonia litorea]|uniref:Component of SufBCD complex n=1 Tax=Yoonia litorea TaxID=1123755 RepID=A0A1I6M4W8_9RHOB|nr:hypothetical protein [Yoonia litorea]SFS10678.1 hypothetical protein SAMN05444714_1232 [Yoonia litorea]
MDLTEAIARFIALDTFDNVWFWAAVIVSWSVACQWLIGVPFDMLLRARRGSAQEMADLEALVDINVRRIMWFQRVAGAGFAGLTAFFLAGTALLAFGYRFEFAIGVFVLAGPLVAIAAMNLQLAMSLHQTPLRGQELVARLYRVRLWTQVAAAASLFMISVFGMAHNVSSSNFF